MADDKSAEKFDFELVSPEQRLIAVEAAMVVIPGEEGEFSVLPNHSALLSSIKPGVIKVYLHKDDETPVRVFVAGGFADVTPLSCSVLAEEAIDLHGLKKPAINKTIESLTEKLAGAKTDPEKRRLQAALDIEKCKLDALDDYAKEMGS